MTVNNNRKLCPLKKNQATFGLCEKEDCEWWNEFKQRCCIVCGAIPSAFSSIKDYIERDGHGK